jgi:plasmid stability protein
MLAKFGAMAQVLIRNIDEQVVLQLKQRAARQGQSMEQYVRDLLRNAVSQPALDRAAVFAQLDALVGSVEYPNGVVALISDARQETEHDLGAVNRVRG